MTKKESTKLKRVIRRHVNAQVDLASKGASNPDYWEAIEEEAQIAKRKLFEFIRELENGL